MSKIIDKENGLVLQNYKEPLREIPQSKGHGYYGAIIVTMDGELMQCHLCAK